MTNSELGGAQLHPRDGSHKEIRVLGVGELNVGTGELCLDVGAYEQGERERWSQRERVDSVVFGEQSNTIN
jgi:hypothetical protein